MSYCCNSNSALPVSAARFSEYNPTGTAGLDSYTGPPERIATRGPSMKIRGISSGVRLVAGCWMLATFAGLWLGARTTRANQATPGESVAGSWVAMVSGRRDDVELVFEFKVQDGNISGWERVPFGDWKIIDGQQKGNHIE